MRRCNAETTDCSTGLVAVPSLQAPRGLELIRSSAKFYANGAGAAKPAIQLSYPVCAASNNPASERTFAPLGHLSIRAIAMSTILLLVLPGLALVAIVWCGTRMAGTGAPVGEASSLLERLASSAVTRSNDPALASNAQSDIIVHTVKTQRIDGTAWAGRDPR